MTRRRRRLVIGYEPSTEGDRALRWAERRAGPDGDVVVVNADDYAADALLRAAEDADADEIVIGLRHHRRLSNVGVCSDLLERSERPVVVVP